MGHKMCKHAVWFDSLCAFFLHFLLHCELFHISASKSSSFYVLLVAFSFSYGNPLLDFVNLKFILMFSCVLYILFHWLSYDWFEHCIETMNTVYHVFCVPFGFFLRVFQLFWNDGLLIFQGSTILII